MGDTVATIFGRHEMPNEMTFGTVLHLSTPVYPLQRDYFTHRTQLYFYFVFVACCFLTPLLDVYLLIVKSFTIISSHLGWQKTSNSKTIRIPLPLTDITQSEQIQLLPLNYSSHRFFMKSLPVVHGNDVGKVAFTISVQFLYLTEPGCQKLENKNLDARGGRSSKKYMKTR